MHAPIHASAYTALSSRTRKTSLWCLAEYVSVCMLVRIRVIFWCVIFWCAQASEHIALFVFGCVHGGILCGCPDIGWICIGHICMRKCLPIKDIHSHAYACIRVCPCNGPSKSHSFSLAILPYAVWNLLDASHGTRLDTIMVYSTHSLSDSMCVCVYILVCENMSGQVYLGAYVRYAFDTFTVKPVWTI